MAVTVKWSRKRLRVQTNDDGTPNWQATIVWEVDGVANEREAYEAVPEAQEGASHPLNGDMTVIAVDAQETRKGLWEVTATYGVRPGQGGGGGPGEILGKPWFDWDETSLELPFDQDIDGNAISNSALDAVDPPDTKEITVWLYTVTVDEPYFDANAIKPYLNAVNLDVFTTPFGTFDPLEVQCKSIRPAERWIPGMKKIRVAYRFEIRAKAFWPNLPDDISPFDTGFPDMGYNAFYNPGGRNAGRQKGRISHKQDGLVNTPVRLDGGGAPWDGDVYKVTRANYDADSGDGPAGASVVGLADMVMLYFKKWHRKPFADFDLPTGTTSTGA